MAPATKKLFQILWQGKMTWLLRTKGPTINFLLRHGIPISFLLAGKILSSIYKFVTTALGTDPDDVIVDTILMACIWVFAQTCLLDWRPEVNSFRLAFWFFFQLLVLLMLSGASFLSSIFRFGWGFA
ncbi:hypothetical protein EV360DRAFT_73851 [Lentinula raphanica]|nr:hypothetical protein EV360DRAFT_73851 [Lentinula raphanica]